MQENRNVETTAESRALCVTDGFDVVFKIYISGEQKGGTQ